MSAICEITPTLSQGSNWEWERSPDEGLLATFDVVVVGCAETSIASSPSARLVLHLPFDDNADGMPDPTWESLYHLTHFCVAKDAKVLTVCSMGENRSGILSAMFLHARHGMTGVQAIALIREKSPPRTNQPYALWNPGFVRQVLERLT